MDQTTSYIFLVWLLGAVSITCESNVEIGVGPVEYGKSVTLKCTLHPPFIAERVTWTKVVGDTTTTVATYTSHSGAEISEGYKDRLWMSTSGLNETAITVHKTSIQDEGCYRCTFNSLLKELITKEACLTFPGEVLIEKHHRVRLLQPVTLTCMTTTISSDKNKGVVEVLWQKNDQQIAIYNFMFMGHIEPKYQGVISLNIGDLTKSVLTLSRVNVSDEGKYKCLFTMYPGGSAAAVMSLQVYEPLNATLSTNHEKGRLKITCVARSWPRSVISWVDVEEGSLNSTTYDGFLTVTSWIVIRSLDTQQMKMPKCKVNYLEKESIFEVSSDVKTEVGPVEYGKSVTLKCILHQPTTAVRVTWTKVVGGRETAVATYTPHYGAEISEGYEDRLWMSTSGLDETAITVINTSIQDEGCYRCTFNYLPKGSITKEMCLTIPGEAFIEKHHRARILQPVTLRCIRRKISKNEKIRIYQVTWQKNDKNIAIYNVNMGEYIPPEYRGVLNVTMEGMEVTVLTLSRVNVSDEGKYKCLFNTFPARDSAAETSLQVYEPLSVTVSKDHENGHLKITCVARSYPQSVISWVDVEEGSLNGTTYDGILTVTSWIVIRSPDTPQMKIPKCKVVYLGEESIFGMSEDH